MGIKKLLLCFGALVSLLPVFAEEENVIFDLTNTMYTSARVWETDLYRDFLEDGFKNFSEKVNARILADKELFLSFKNLCPNCTGEYIKNSLDKDERLNEILYADPGTIVGLTDIALVALSHANNSITQGVVQSSINALNEILTEMIADIRTQVLEQTYSLRDIGGIGIFYDRDIDNSPYDLLEDIRKIDEIFFRELPDGGDYVNETEKDKKDLLEKSDINNSVKPEDNGFSGGIQSEVNTILKPEKKNIDNEIPLQKKEEKDPECEDGYCLKNSIIKNTALYQKDDEKNIGKNSFEGLFEAGLEWLIRHGDNRNFACKVSPTINVFESEFDSNAKLNQLQSGTSIFTFFTIGPVLQGYLDRYSREIHEHVEEKNNETYLKQEERRQKEIDDLFSNTFKKNGMNYERPSDISGRLIRAFNYFAVNNARDFVTTELSSSNDVRSNEGYLLLKRSFGRDVHRSIILGYTEESLEHLEKFFEEIESRTRMLSMLILDLRTITDYLLEKKDCQSS